MDTNVSWKPVLKPGQAAEARLVRAFLDGTFPINSRLPAERELAEMLGVTRPTLREALQRLERDGFVEIQHGKPTRVRDFWLEGNLGVTLALAQYQHPLPHNFVADLFSVRVLLAPTYTSAAISRSPGVIATFLAAADQLTDDAQSYSSFDCDLHAELIAQAGNTFFIHFMNSIKALYQVVGEPYFSHPQTRSHSRDFYRQLIVCARNGDSRAAGELARRVMEESAAFWEELSA